MSEAGWIAAACILFFRLPGVVRFIGFEDVVLFLLSWFHQAKAAGEACTGVRDYDRRQACFAEAKGQPDQCTSIRDQDQRTICQVRAKMRRR
jgi:hypothetical protein